MAVTSGYLMPHPPVLIPQVGQGRETVCRATSDGYAAASADFNRQKPSLVVLITPHGPLFSDGMAIGAEPTLTGNLKAFGAPEVQLSFPNAPEWVSRIIREAGTLEVPLVGIDQKTARQYGVTPALDHGALVPLYFLSRQWSGFRLIHITYGLLSIPKLYQFGQLLARLFTDAGETVAVVASGDLSHCLKSEGPYDYHPDGPRFDEAVIRHLSAGDFTQLLTLDPALVKNAGECAYRSLAILGGSLDALAFEPTCYSYEGPFGVGYGVCGFAVTGPCLGRLPQLTERWEQGRRQRLTQEDPWVRLARATVEAYVRTGSVPALPPDLPEAMLNDQNGVFVSLKGPSGLRGCIGTFLPTTTSVAREIQENAVKAATEDPRFPPVEAEELEELTVTVDVLSPPEPVASAAALDPKRYGVIVASGFKRGLLLPALDGVDTVEEQVRIARQKAGISETEAVTLQRFEVVRHH